MPWSGSAGSKTFGRNNGFNAGEQVWQTDDAQGVDIVSNRHDTHDQDLADGINSTLMKDGGNTATANLPMGGFKHTNVGDAAARTQYASLAQMMDKGAFYIPTVGGSANAITLTTGFSMSAYATGQKFRFKVASTNTGATTVNIDSIGAKSIVRTATGVAVTSGDLIADAIVDIAYDGTNFQLTTPSVTATSADVYARIVKAGSVVAWPHATVPTGWLECDGSAISRTTYAELFANISTTYGIGDGSTTFNIPNYKDYFLRGFDSSGTDAATRTDRGDGTTGANVGTKQASDYLSHTHTGTTDSNGAHRHFGAKNTNTPTVGEVDANTAIINENPGQYLFPGTSAEPDVGRSTSDGAHTHTFTSAASPTSGGTETRSKNITVKWIILALPSAAAAGTLGVHGLQYAWNTATSGDPGTGKLLVNHATLASATALNIYETDAYGAGVGAFLATWDDSTSTIKGFIHVAKVGAPGTYAIFSVSGTLTDNGSYDTFTVAHVSSAGTLANGDNVSVLFYRNGDKGDTGTTGSTGPPGADGITPAVQLTFDSATTDADPGAGEWRFNNATLSSVTAAYIDNVDAAGATITGWLDSFDDTNDTARRGHIEFRDISAPATFAKYLVTGTVVDGTGYRKLTLSHLASNGTFAGLASVTFAPAGDKGADGAGTGDVVGPASATDNAVVRFDSTTGKLVQDSVVTIADTSGNMAGVGTLASAAHAITSTSANALAVGANGATNPVLKVDANTASVATGVSVTGAAAAGRAAVAVLSSGTDEGLSVDAKGAGTIRLGATSTGAVEFSRNAVPTSSDGAALGTSSLMWADLFLASGGVINWNNGNFTITHSAGLLTMNGAMSLGTSNAFTCGTIELGAASDTTISRSAAGVIAVEGVPLYSNIPQNSQSAAYTTVLGDAQKHILHPTADNNARTFTIDSNANVAYPIGTAITFINQINTVTISITSDTLTLAGAGTTGSRTLAANGIATAIKIASTSWIISGTGLT